MIITLKRNTQRYNFLNEDIELFKEKERKERKTKKEKIKKKKEKILAEIEFIANN